METGLAGLPAQAFGFMLVIARVGSAMLAGPGFGENDVPASIRMALAVVLAILVYPALESRLPSIPPGFGDLAALLVIEIVVGLWLGLSARLMLAALAMAGGILSLSIGLSSVLQIDPASGAQVSALQRMMSMAAVALFFTANLYLYPLQAVLGSYDVITPGHALDGGGMAEMIVHAVTSSFGLAIQLSAPFIILSIAWQAAVGFLSRLVPNIQVHVVSAPGQILGGLALLAVAIATLFGSWTSSLMAQFATLPGL